MNLSSILRTIALSGLILMLPALDAVAAAKADEAKQDEVWNAGLRAVYFGDRHIEDGSGVIELDAPVRAEDPAVVPISIQAKFPQSEDRFIKSIFLVIDRNPSAMAGKFHFTPASGRADLAVRVRFNAYSPIRAIAETNDGKLYMARKFVKASGGCSAPVGTDLEAALTRLGKMRFKTPGEGAVNQPMQTQLAISHPNVTGMQMDQLSQLYAPAHYVEHVKVNFDGVPVFEAETDFSLSENPNFRFFFVPHRDGELQAEVTDNTGKRFVSAHAVTARKAPTAD